MFVLLRLKTPGEALLRDLCLLSNYYFSCSMLDCALNLGTEDEGEGGGSKGKREQLADIEGIGASVLLTERRPSIFRQFVTELLLSGSPAVSLEEDGRRHSQHTPQILAARPSPELCDHCCN